MKQHCQLCKRSQTSRRTHSGPSCCHLLFTSLRSIFNEFWESSLETAALRVSREQTLLIKWISQQTERMQKENEPQLSKELKLPERRIVTELRLPWESHQGRQICSRFLLLVGMLFLLHWFLWTLSLPSHDVSGAISGKSINIFRHLLGSQHHHDLTLGITASLVPPFCW